MVPIMIPGMSRIGLTDIRNSGSGKNSDISSSAHNINSAAGSRYYSSCGIIGRTRTFTGAVNL